MRWNSWLYIILAEILFAALSTVGGLLANIITNEKHPSVGFIVGLVAFGVFSALLQALRTGKAKKNSRLADEKLAAVADNTLAILNRRIDADNREAERAIDETLRTFPSIHRSWIKRQWRLDQRGIERVLDALSDPATSRPNVVTEWQRMRPSWFSELGWQALLVAGELAGAYGASQLSADLFAHAVANGTTREPYWLARAALVEKSLGHIQAAHTILARGAVDADTLDQLAKVVYQFVNDDRPATQSLADAWEPQTAIDHIVKASIEVGLIFAERPRESDLAARQLDRAIAVYRSLMNAVPSSASARIALAGVLLASADRNVSANRHRDLQEAIRLATEARNLQRAVGASSVEAVELACQAAYSDMMPTQVIELGTAVTGEATTEEAASDIVRSLVANAALAKGSTDISDQLIPQIADPFRKAFLIALATEVGGNASAVLWEAALAQARSAGEHAQALLGLARAGVLVRPDDSRLDDVSPSDRALIEAVSTATSGDVHSAIERLRTMPGTDFNAAMALAEAYLTADNVAAAVNVMREAAHTTNEPRLRVEAARLLWGRDEKENAQLELESVLVDSASDARIRHDCLALLGQWASEQRQWATAQQRFEELLALDERDEEARWAVILVMVRQGLIEEARRTYESAPVKLTAASPDQARAWIVMGIANADCDEIEYVNGVLDVAGQFKDDEEVQGQAIAAILAPREQKTTLPLPTQMRFNNLIESFFKTWPESSRIRRFNASDIESLVRQMADIVRPSQEEKVLRDEIADQLARNTLPWAFLSAITGRSYSEIVVLRAGGILPARHNDAAEQQMCTEAAQAAINKNVVLDITAAAVLLELPEINDTLIGKFDRLTSSEGERLDAMNAVAFLRGRSTSSWVYDEQTDRGRLVEISEDLAEAHFAKATELLSLIRMCRIVHVAEDSRLHELRNLATPSWATAVQCAAQNEIPFWCDDVALRGLARSIGVRSFSTPALLEVLLQHGQLTAEQYEGAIRRLIKGFVGDFALHHARLSGILAGGREAVGPIASIFSRYSAWADVNSACQIWSQLVKQAVAFDRACAAEMLYLAVIGIARVQRSPTNRREAAALLLSAAVSVVASYPVSVAQCVAAARMALSTVRQTSADDDDPLGRTIEMLHATFVYLLGLKAATTHLSFSFSALDGSDRQKVLEVRYR
jgi:tetratricopeptide (TPR) repeat protein